MSYTLENAIDLAWMLRGRPGQNKTGIRPTIQESIEIISACQKTIGCNWITGQTALELLREAGKESK